MAVQPAADEFSRINPPVFAARRLTGRVLVLIDGGHRKEEKRRGIGSLCLTLRSAETGEGVECRSREDSRVPGRD